MGKKPKLLPGHHRYQRLKKIVTSINNVENLKENLDRVLNILEEGGVTCPMHINPLPPVMWHLIKKADVLITSEVFIPLLQSLMPLYIEFEHEPNCRHGRIILTALCEQIGRLVHHPEKTMEMFQIFIAAGVKQRDLNCTLSSLYDRVMIEPDLSVEEPLITAIERALVDKGADEVKARSRCLWLLLSRLITWESTPHLTKTTGAIPSLSKEEESIAMGDDDEQLEWSVDIVNGLKKLVEKGADPNWVIQVYHDDQDYNASSLYVFLMGIDAVLGEPENESIFPDLMQLLDLMMTDNKLDTELDIGGRTILHILVGKEWYQSKLIHNLDTCSQMFVNVVSSFLHHEKTQIMLDMVNNIGHTPFHSFLLTILHAYSARRDPKILLFASHILPLLISPTTMNLQDQNGDTPLHGLMKYVTFDSSAGEFCTIAKSIASSINIEVQNKKQQTPLLLLAERLYACDLPRREHANDTLALIDAIATSKNINMADKELMSPYSFMLLIREKITAGVATGEVDFLKDVEELLLEKGAEVEVARQGYRHKQSLGVRKEITDLLGSIWRSGRLDEDTLTHMTQLKDSYYPECLDSAELAENLCGTCIEFFSVKDVPQLILFRNLAEMLLCESNTQEVWTRLVKEIPDIRDFQALVTIQKILKRCVMIGAKPSSAEIAEIGLSIDQHRSSKMHLTVLHFLLETFRSYNKVDVIPVRLDLLSNIYMISQDYRKIGSSIVKLAFQTLENCMSSGSVVNILLFVMDDNVENDYELTSCFSKLMNFFDDNWLQRSILHLTMMYCNDRRVLDCLPKYVLSKLINITDVHGCTPLHLAYLCGNDVAVEFLLAKDADNYVEDHFGITPRTLGLRVGVTECVGQLQTVSSKFEDEGEGKQTEHVDVDYQKHCKEVMETESNVFELMKPMMALPEEDRLLQSNDVKRLFERFVELMPDLLKGEIVVAGSSREKLKAGRLDEVDVQIRFHVLSSYLKKVKRDFWMFDIEQEEKSDDSKRLDENCFGEWLHTCLLQNLPYVDWQDIPLRLISVSHPWYFIYERPGPTQYVHMSVDVVPIIRVLDDSIVKYPLLTKQHEMLLRQFLILNRSIPHKRMWFLRWGNFSRAHSFITTYCEYEWDILDSLATGPRLGVLIVKALLEISYASEGGSLAGAQKPITSYMLKTVLFWLLCDEEALKNPMDVIEGYYDVGKGWPSDQETKMAENSNVVRESDEDKKRQGPGPEEIEGGTGGKEVLVALNDQVSGQAEGGVDDEQDFDPATSATEEMEEEASQNSGIKVPSWMNMKDLDDHVEEGRTWAVKILQTILNLTDKVGERRDEGQLLPFFEIRYDTFLLNHKNKDRIAQLCRTLLGRVSPEIFYSHCVNV